MKTFRVWLRDLGHDCRVRVDGITNAEWLLQRLSQSFIFKTSQPVREEEGSSCCTFRVAYAFKMSPQSLGRILAGMPEVQFGWEKSQERGSIPSR